MLTGTVLKENPRTTPVRTVMMQIIGVAGLFYLTSHGLPEQCTVKLPHLFQAFAAACRVRGKDDDARFDKLLPTGKGCRRTLRRV